MKAMMFLLLQLEVMMIPLVTSRLNSVTVMSYIKDKKVLNGEGLYVCVGHSA